MIPPFRADGYLPEGVHIATDAEATFRFGSSNSQRRRLALRLRRWIELIRDIGGKRLMIDGSFITSRENPRDIDAVVLLPHNFQNQLTQAVESALELEEMLLTRRPAEIFAAEDDNDWQEWLEFFARTREADGRRKGLVEIEL